MPHDQERVKSQGCIDCQLPVCCCQQGGQPPALPGVHQQEQHIVAEHQLFQLQELLMHLQASQTYTMAMRTQADDNSWQEQPPAQASRARQLGKESSTAHSKAAVRITHLA